MLNGLSVVIKFSINSTKSDLTAIEDNNSVGAFASAFSGVTFNETPFFEF